MNRKHFMGIAGIGGFAAISGCETLDQLDTSAAAEGTGVQFSGLIKVLVKYEASPRQRQTAQVKGGKAYVKLALEPAYQKRQQTLKVEQQKEIKQTAKSQSAELAQVKKKSPSEAAQLKAKQAASLAAMQEDARQQLLASNASFREQAAKITQGSYSPNVQLPKQGEVAQINIRREVSALMADAARRGPQMLAVSVPAAGKPEEARAADSVMFYDAKRLTLASNQVSVVDRTPKTGSNGNFGGVSALYAGKGL
ncbi:MAG: hypothetical protein ACI8UO_006121 [Verrucomicrobiales bacterium]|jgi:hypothetical protein